jgi:hypothetical protein
MRIAVVVLILLALVAVCVVVFYMDRSSTGVAQAVGTLVS